MSSNGRRVQVLGVDAGGTMSDTFFVDEEGEFIVGKAQSTPDDESRGLIASSRDALKNWELDAEEAFPQLTTGVYSGTALLNRVVQREGLKVGLIVNRGMEDSHRMGRAIQSYLSYAYEDRLHLNTHRYDPPLVPRRLTRGVTERVDLFGQVAIPLREEEAYQAAGELLDEDVEGIAIVFLHSYKDPTHERRVRDIAHEVIQQRNLQIPVFASVDYYPVRKENHRANTTILEAYAAEPSRQTLVRLDKAFKELGAPFDTRVMASHGGTISWKAKELARTLVSGPIGGVIGAKYLGEQLGYKNIACTDIGGTSFDMALIVKGDFTINQDPDMARLLLSLPLVAMNSVGAGAGSFVRIDPYSNAITLGPDSAGYRVGVCWPDSGIDTVSVTDCHVVLGYLNPDNFLGGELKLDPERARNAIKEQLADKLGVSVEEAAAGVIELLDFQLSDHLRSMISAKGYLPADFVCFSYGGAGPVHTYGYTKDLGFEDVVVPAFAAGFSAFGCAAADFEYRYDKSLDISAPPNIPESGKEEAVRILQAAWDELSERVVDEFVNSGFDRSAITLVPGYRMQYSGQLNDLEIDAPEDVENVESAQDWDRLTETYEDTYGYVYARSARSPELGFSVTGAIMKGTVPVRKPEIPKEPLSDKKPPEEASLGRRSIYYRGDWREADLWSMEGLEPGNQIQGPAIIESDATTFVVPDGFGTYLDEHRLFHLRQEK